MELKAVKTNKAPLPKGAYSQAVVIDKFVFVSGQLPIDPSTNDPLYSDLESQVHLVFNNLKNILEESGSGFEKVAKITIYISDIKHWDTVNNIYQNYVNASVYPSRTIVPTKELHFDLPIEVDAIAYI